ncbi:SNF2-related protein [Bacillus tianshenii]|nr:SNF2-related protein [Bacillus tianshenii]
MNVPIRFDTAWQEQFLQKVNHDGPWSSPALYQLAYEVGNHLLVHSFHGLIAPSFLPQLTPLPHQLETAETVIEQMNGKAILADEVGLGKTIEAGLILKEYMIRGLVKRALILVPASLVSQWTIELNTKFYIPAVSQRKTYVWEQCDVIVSSIDTAKRAPHRDIILNQNYDLIIIDEAHKLKNHKTKNYEFVQQLKKKYCLLLTATPVQNRIEEIFNLVSLLKPGYLGSIDEFNQNFSAKERSLQGDERLKALVNQVMVRNRRKDTKMDWPKRIVETVPVEFSPEEQKLYDMITETRKHGGFTLLTLQREVCSSREAAYMTLKQMYEKDPLPFYETLFEQINKIEAHAKAKKALEIVQKIGDKVIIFTEYRATQMYLQWYLAQHGISSVPFRGGFKRSKKDWMRELFRNHAQVLIATEAGGEGINLQFCNHIINYDLPWNPMRVEQRIGRIHRLGQERDVHIYNFSIKNTVEEHILTLLYEKINLFERVIGELDEILTRLDFQQGLEKHIEEIVTQSTSEGEIKIKMDNLTSYLKFGEHLSAPHEASQ